MSLVSPQGYNGGLEDIVPAGVMAGVADTVMTHFEDKRVVSQGKKHKQLLTVGKGQKDSVSPWSPQKEPALRKC